MGEMNRREGGRATAMRKGAPLLLATVMAAIGFLAAVALAAGASRTNGTVSLRTTRLGRVLVSSNGHTLYLFAKDRNGRSACSGSCATYWPPLLTPGKPTAGSGVKASLLGTTRRSNGKLQVTYNKHPLYRYLLDKRAGQTTGERNSAFGGTWYAVSARGTAIVNVPATPPPPPPTTTTTTSPTTTSPYP